MVGGTAMASMGYNRGMPELFDQLQVNHRLAGKETPYLASYSVMPWGWEDNAVVLRDNATGLEYRTTREQVNENLVLYVEPPAHAQRYGATR